jgi:hypothetical protein
MFGIFIKIFELIKKNIIMKNLKYLIRFMILFIYILNLEGSLYNLFNESFFLLNNVEDIEKKRNI